MKLAGSLELFIPPATSRTYPPRPSPLSGTPEKARLPHQYAQTQQNVSASSLVQSEPARGFHETIWSERMPNLAAMPSQVSPHCT